MGMIVVTSLSGSGCALVVAAGAGACAAAGGGGGARAGVTARRGSASVRRASEHGLEVGAQSARRRPRDAGGGPAGAACGGAAGVGAVAAGADRENDPGEEPGSAALAVCALDEGGGARSDRAPLRRALGDPDSRRLSAPLGLHAAEADPARLRAE